jgi:hypothetical protein
MRRSLYVILAGIICLFFANFASADTVTVAAFADPSGNSFDPLFSVNWTEKTVEGGWADYRTGLNLIVKVTGSDVVFNNAWFAMSQLEVIEMTNLWGNIYGKTGAGTINFYQDNTSQNPVLTIAFDESFISQQSVGSKDFFGQNVTITGSAVPFQLSMEEFSFSFVNVTNNPDGFTATASFNASAVPEPMTIALLGLGGIVLLRKRR